MRLLTAAGVLIFSTGAAFGAYLVELDGGDRMTVDSYWQEDDRMHLRVNGGDLSVPRDRVRGIHEISGPDAAGVKPRLAPTAPSRHSSGESDSRREIERSEKRIAHHVVRLTRDLSIARSRGDKPSRVKRLERELTHTQNRWRDATRELAAQ